MAKRRDFSIFAKIFDIPEEESNVIHIMPGEQIGPNERYEIVTLIGTGDMGAVYIAKDRQDTEGKLYALKFPHYMLFSQEEVLDNFIGLVKWLIDSPHENILDVLDVWKQGSLYFYTMNYVEGPSLAEWIQAHKSTKNYLPFSLSCKIILQICKALCHLHKHSPHGALHPDNVLFTDVSNTHIKITDCGFYGLSNVIWKQPTDLVPNNRYRAPEQRKTSDVDRRHDIFAVGMILYELLTYRLPQYPYEKVCEIREDIPLRVDAIIEKAIKVSAEDRYAKIEDLHKDMANLLSMYLRNLSNVSDYDTARYEPQLYDTDSISRDDPRILKLIETVSGNQKSDDENPALYETNIAASSQMQDLIEEAQRRIAKIEALIQQAEECEQQHNYQRAMELWAEAFSLREDPEIEKRLESARELAEKEMGTVEELFKKAKQHELEKRYPEAIELYSQVLKLREDKEAEKARSNSQVMLEKAQELKSQARDSKDLMQASIWASGSLAIYPFDEETQELKKSISSKKETFSQLCEEAAKYEEKKQFPKALKFYEEALDIKNDEQILNKTTTIGKILEQALDFKHQAHKHTDPIEAYKLVSESLKLYPHDSQAKELQESLAEKKQQEKSKQTTQEKTDRNSQQWIKEAEEFEKSKKYTDALEFWEKSLEIKDSPEVRQKIAEVKRVLNNASRLMEQAKEALENNDPYKAYDCISESVYLYPHNPESQEVCTLISHKMQNLEKNVQDSIEEGDQLAQEENFKDAIVIWQKVAGLSPVNAKEIRDRIMQVVDIAAEQAQELLDQGECYQAHSLLNEVVDYSEDQMIKDLHREIEHEVQERENNFTKAIEEAEKHFQKRQYKEAIHIWSSVKGITLKDDVLDKKIQNAQEIYDNLEKDEEEYLSLTSIARSLEQKGDYNASLQALERIKQRKWTCPTSDLKPEIERISKLVAAVPASEEAKKLLHQAEKSINNKNVKAAKEILENPVLQKKLLPNVEERLLKVKEQWLLLKKQRQKSLLIICSIIFAISIAAAVAVIKLM